MLLNIFNDSSLRLTTISKLYSISRFSHSKHLSNNTLVLNHFCNNCLQKRHKSDVNEVVIDLSLDTNNSHLAESEGKAPKLKGKPNQKQLKSTSLEKNYSKSVLLPKSNFSLKHCRRMESFDDISVKKFVQLVDKKPTKGRFVLHDGPPYANGSLHFGHAINKFLKDMICRRKLLEGHNVSFLPGWDCHGLPIELKAITEDFQSLKPIEIRRKAKQLALNVIEEQKKNFREWGIIGDWDNPYLTLDSVYIKNQINSFYKLYEKGLVFRSSMPVHWSTSAQTALAEAELIYNENHVSQSVFVKLKLTTIPSIIENFESIYALIWTTTPWTLPANEAIAYASNLDYSVVTIDKLSEDHLLVANELIPNLEKSFDSRIEIKQTFKGSELKGITYTNPISLNDECLPFLESSYVTTTKGTGLVHTAPNHGLDDYNLILKNNIPIKQCIVNERGCYVCPSNPVLDKKFVLKEGNEAVMSLLGKSLLFRHEYIHSYPYDWRSNEPVIVRASPQWFLNVNLIREDCIKALESVKFYPEFYKQYLINQLKVRPNWCISRQRSWGVPIPVFFRKEDHDLKYPIISKQIVDNISKQFEEKGCDVWWLSNTEDLISNEMIENELNISTNDLVKGKDIFDIWFDSGNSWNTALEEPKIADIYLEGYDQLRGWFQSSLIVSVALRNCSPYRSLVIHGFALDRDGKKMSKSIGNVINPNDIIESKKNEKNNCGSDGFRFWVAQQASDHKDVKVSIDSFDDTLVSINKIRNTIRFIIGNLNEFDASKDLCDLSEMKILDKYVLHLLHKYINDIEFCFNNLQFGQLIQSTHNFIVGDISAFYFSRIKHRLYCEHKSSLSRRSAQTVILYLYNSIVFQLAPILPHIMIEANNHLPINNEFIQNNEDWNQQNIEKDIQLIIDINNLISKGFPSKNLIEYDCYIKTPDIKCIQNLSLFQPEFSATDSDLCEILVMSSVSYSDSDLPNREGITLSGSTDEMNYELLITSANNYLCNRCRRYTAITETKPCDHCLKVLSFS